MQYSGSVVALVAATAMMFIINISAASAVEKSTTKVVASQSNTRAVPEIEITQNDKSGSASTAAKEEPIKGFHPIKKLIAPIVRLEKSTIELQKQINQLTRPIDSLSPVMLDLHSGMDAVNNRMGVMQKLLNSMSTNVGRVSTGMDRLADKMQQVRSDIGGMRGQISKLEIPIRQLEKPLHELEDPLQNIAQPLRDLHSELNQLKSLIAFILVAIVASACAIAIGTPIAAVMVYKHRAKLFPHLSVSENKMRGEGRNLSPDSPNLPNSDNRAEDEKTDSAENESR